MKRLAILIIVIIVGIIILLLLKNDTEAPTIPNNRSGSVVEENTSVGSDNTNEVNEPRTIEYTCDQGDVTLTLSGENYMNAEVVTATGEFSLSHAVSASGARYTTSDESFVFWSQGNEAFIEQNGTTTYENCTEK